jgi:hypothetical protein
MTIRNCFGLARNRTTPSLESFLADLQEIRRARENFGAALDGGLVRGSLRVGLASTGFEILMPPSLAGLVVFFTAVEADAGRVGRFNLNLEGLN